MNIQKNTYFVHSTVLGNCKRHVKVNFSNTSHMLSCSLSMMHVAVTAPTEMKLSLARITLSDSASSGSPQMKAKGWSVCSLFTLKTHAYIWSKQKDLQLCVNVTDCTCNLSPVCSMPSPPPLLLHIDKWYLHYFGEKNVISGYFPDMWPITMLNDIQSWTI